jgi:hypothetical protein
LKELNFSNELPSPAKYYVMLVMSVIRTAADWQVFKDHSAASRIKDLSSCFSACSYVLWKVVARHLPTPKQRTAFCTAVGAELLQQLAPNAVTSLKEAAAAAGESWQLLLLRRCGLYAVCPVVLTAACPCMQSQ